MRKALSFLILSLSFNTYAGKYSSTGTIQGHCYIANQPAFKQFDKQILLAERELKSFFAEEAKCSNVEVSYSTSEPSIYMIKSSYEIVYMLDGCEMKALEIVDIQCRSGAVLTEQEGHREIRISRQGESMDVIEMIIKY